MRTTIDAAGRVVIPKAIRDELELAGGREIDLTVADGKIEITIPAIPMRLVQRDGVTVAVTDRPMPPLTADQVRETLERLRR